MFVYRWRHGQQRREKVGGLWRRAKSCSGETQLRKEHNRTLALIATRSKNVLCKNAERDIEGRGFRVSPIYLKITQCLFVLLLGLHFKDLKYTNVVFENTIQRFV